MNDSRFKLWLHGLTDGLPIGLGYFAVAFSLGIAARNVGLSVGEGFLASLLCNASAGEYAGFTAIAARATLLELAAVTLVANARYLLMSAALSQRFSSQMPLRHRFLVAFDVTDEIFALAIARPAPLEPSYLYGAFVLPMLGWSGGTALGIAVGNWLPPRIVSALSVALYGMFIAIVVPPARKNPTLSRLVCVSLLCSAGFAVLPGLRQMNESLRVVVLTLLLAGGAAWLWPLEEERDGA